MKRENLGWLVAAGVVLLAVTMGAVQSTSTPGRWTIVSLDMFIPHAEGGRVPFVFLLDTQTGKTFIKASNPEEWCPIEHGPPRP
jgi:hypothetical protein